MAKRQVRNLINLSKSAMRIALAIICQPQRNAQSIVVIQSEKEIAYRSGRTRHEFARLLRCRSHRIAMAARLPASPIPKGFSTTSSAHIHLFLFSPNLNAIILKKIPSARVFHYVFIEPSHRLNNHLCVFTCLSDDKTNQTA